MYVIAAMMTDPQISKLLHVLSGALSVHAFEKSSRKKEQCQQFNCHLVLCSLKGTSLLSGLMCQQVYQHGVGYYSEPKPFGNVF